ncbi:MAG: T9SS type A sorting domain-containing protein [Gammaproteobacteria bacterium]|nr:T9SS type A sorting domain-containing protein [Gammaproteobacteria bacterium]
MKKLLFSTLVLGAMTTSSFAIFQMDVSHALFQPGHAPESAVMKLFGNPTLFNHTNILPADGFPLMFHVLFDYDAVLPGGAVEYVDLTSGSCTQRWTPPMFTVFYMVGPAFPVDGVYGAFGAECYCMQQSCYVDPTALDFGVVHSPAPVIRTFQICNNSVGVCPPISGTITENCETFSVAPSSYTLATGECVTVTVTFVGTHAGMTTCDIITGCGTVVCTVDDQVSADEAPAVFALGEAYPNPFNPTTTIAYSVPETQAVTLSVFNTNGQLVQTLVNGMVERGEHKVVFDASSLSSGVYVYTLATANQTEMKKMVLVK